jgi:hypothetical protein
MRLCWYCHCPIGFASRDQRGSDPLSRATTQAPREGKSTVIMTDDDIEAMLRDMVEKHLPEDARAAALNWLEKRSLTYEAAMNLELLDKGQADD